MLWDFVVQYEDTPTTSVEITNVQQVTVNGGREAVLDNFSATRCNITCRYPNGYATPLPNLIPGAVISVQAFLIGDPTKLFNVFTGKVTDVTVQYGIPYQSNVGPADYLEISAEGGLGAFGRAAGNGYSMPAGTLQAQSNNLYVTSGFSLYFEPMDSARTTNASSATVNSTWADWLNQTAATIGGRLQDGLTSVRLYPNRPSYVATITLSDQASSATKVPYDQITFDSLSQNYFTQITVDPENYAAQIASDVPAGESPRNYTVNTYSDSTGQAADLAGYYLALFGDPELGIASISVNLNDDRTLPIESLLKFGPDNFNLPIGALVNVEFRGQVYPCFIEGGVITASPDAQRVTFYLSSAALNNLLILDNATFGQLDSNRLGF